jgi:hypothetical protein
MSWIHLAQDRGESRVLANMVMNLRVPLRGGGRPGQLEGLLASQDEDMELICYHTQPTNTSHLTRVYSS